MIFAVVILLHLCLLVYSTLGGCAFHPFKRDRTPYAIVPLHFIGPLTRGGENISINGTAEQIAFELRRLNPNYDEEFKMELTELQNKADNLKYCLETGTLPLNATAEYFGEGMAAMKDYNRASGADSDSPVIYDDMYDEIECWREKEYGAKVKDTIENMLDLVKIVGLAGASPMCCSRVSCKWSNGIEWCNHHEDVELQVDPWVIYYNVLAGLYECPWWDRHRGKDTNNINHWVDFEARGAREDWAIMVCEEKVGC